MPVATTIHPHKNQLIAFGQGKLAADEQSLVEQHLEACAECCETLLELKDDTFVELVKIAKPSSSPSGSFGQASAHEATVFVQSGEPTTADELPVELRNHPRYRIVELIGRGGMGNVFRAEHRLMNRPVAIKLINSQLVRNPQAVERFRREVQAAAKLCHPNIVGAFDAEQAGNAHFLVMEFVDGTDLASVVKQRGPLPVVEACEYLRQAAAGLQHAHEKGMVHRDIKPHNLMLDADGQVRILDFGLAGFVETLGDSDSTAPLAPLPEAGRGEPLLDRQALTTLGSVMGTPDYMAPEQATDAHSADIRADIYSLGCTLYFLLTGQPPFTTDNVIAKLKAHAQQPPPPLTGVPTELSKVAARMLAKQPADRFQTPAELAAALEPFTSVSFRSAKGSFAERKTTLFAAMLGFLLLFAGVIVIATDRGRLEIHSEVDDVKIVVKKRGEQVEIVDLKTGSQLRWLPGGEYELQVVGRQNDVKLDKSSFQMSRLGHVIVTANWNAAALGVVRTFTANDKPITQDGVAPDDGGWKITATEIRTVRLFEVPTPRLDAGPFYFRAKLKTESVTGRAYLEMWNRFPGKGEFFSKGFNNAVSGTTGWAEYEIPFVLKPGEQPDLVKLNVTIEGSGTVWIKDIELRGKIAAKPVAKPAPYSTVPTGKNLVTDPSLEATAIGEKYPANWGTGNLTPPGAYQHRVVAGGRTDEHGWQIEGDGQFAVVPTNRPPANPAYRYAASAWVRAESGGALIKLLYFDANNRYIQRLPLPRKPPRNGPPKPFGR